MTCETPHPVISPRPHGPQMHSNWRQLPQQLAAPASGFLCAFLGPLVFPQWITSAQAFNGKKRTKALKGR